MAHLAKYLDKVVTHNDFNDRVLVLWRTNFIMASSKTLLTRPVRWAMTEGGMEDYVVYQETQCEQRTRVEDYVIKHWVVLCMPDPYPIDGYLS